jgi:hypothetical protein
MLVRWAWVIHLRRLARLMLIGLLAGLLTMAADPAIGLVQGWSKVPSPNGPGGSKLYGMSCVSATDCAAVGSSNGSPGQPLTESWNGTSWSVVPSPHKNKTHDVLEGVSCVSATDCTAVGYAQANTYATLIESWNGTAWLLVPSPDQTGTNNVLYAVSCVSASDCTAVGGSVRALIESWNGAAWSVVPSPDPGSLADTLYGVSCVSASDCTAVGYYGNVGGHTRTLVESWNGTTWSVVSSPNKQGTGNVLEGVSCVSASDCTAAGARSSSSGVTTLIESWNGTAWSVIPSPDKASANNELVGVSCAAANACTAVGDDAKISGPARTLIESWDGITWSIVPSPNKGVDPDFLKGVWCGSASDCTAVGYYGSPFKTLIESSNG